MFVSPNPAKLNHLWDTLPLLRIPPGLIPDIVEQTLIWLIPDVLRKDTIEGKMGGVGPLLLLIFCVWHTVEARLFTKHLRAYRPAPVPWQPTYTTQDVSLVCCTVATPDRFIPCLRSWLANKPLEIIIVTTEEWLNSLEMIIANYGLPAESLSKIRICTAARGKRAQLSRGIQAAKGGIIASCDDQISWNPNFLQAMLAPFEDFTVGAAAPTTHPFIPEERRDSNVITPYEIAAIRSCFKRNPNLEMTYGAARWCYIMAGCSCLIRASILKDPAFRHGYNNDYWRGKYKLDVGEDCYISRWIQKMGWTIAVQSTPETMVWRVVRTTNSFFTQMVRWERSTIQSHIRMLWEVPQIWGNFHVARKVLGRLLRPIFTWVHIVVWIWSLVASPLLTLLVVSWYAHEALPSYLAFFEEYPYTRSQWWAVVLSDFFHVIQDPWSWATLSDASTQWEKRPKL